MKSDKSVRELILEMGLMDEVEIDKILDYKRMTRPGILDEEHMEKN